MKWVLGAIGVLIIIGAVAFPIVRAVITKTQLTKESVLGMVRTMAIIAVLGVVVLLMSSAVVQIEAGNVGVVKQFGAVTGTKFEPGLHFKMPIAQTVEVYRTQQIIYETSDDPYSSQATYTDFSVETMTEDGQRITVRFTVVFNIDPTKADWIAQNIGTEGDVIEKVVKANCRSEARNIPKSFKASDLYGANVYACQRAIFDKLQPVFENNGVVLVEFLLRDIGFDENLAQALEQKQIALERQVTASREVEVKKAEAAQQIEAAKGVAQAEIEKAKGQAEAIRLINEQLSAARFYNQYLVSKGIAEGTTDIQWIVPEGSMPILDLAQITGGQPTQ
jgi:regulator of protease activity HflC (stomatin/prohibitin superfamily)